MMKSKKDTKKRIRDAVRDNFVVAGFLYFLSSSFIKCIHLLSNSW
jgi:folate-dependent phosphoribosylglycinamide formyltransferase PurN